MNYLKLKSSVFFSAQNLFSSGGSSLCVRQSILTLQTLVGANASKRMFAKKTKEEEGFDKQVSLLLFMTQREQTKQNDQEPSTALDDYCESFVFAWGSGPNWPGTVVFSTLKEPQSEEGHKN